MTLKMQREDTVSGFSFLFPARYSPVEDAICPAGQPQGAGDGAGGDPKEPEGVRHPRPPGKQADTMATPAQPKIPLGVVFPPLPRSGTQDVQPKQMQQCLGCPSCATWEKATRAVYIQQERET